MINFVFYQEGEDIIRPYTVHKATIHQVTTIAIKACMDTPLRDSQVGSARQVVGSWKGLPAKQVKYIPEDKGTQRWRK